MQGTSLVSTRTVEGIDPAFWRMLPNHQPKGLLGAGDESVILTFYQLHVLSAEYELGGFMAVAGTAEDQSKANLDYGP